MLPCSLQKLIVVPFFLNNKLRCSPKFTFPQFPCSQKLCSLFPWSPKIFLTVPHNFSHISFSFLPVHYLMKVPHWGKICLQEDSPTTGKEIRPLKPSSFCHPALPSLKRIQMGKWHLIQNQQRRRKIFKKPPLISYRKGKSLKDLLVSLRRQMLFKSSLYVFIKLFTINDV